MDSNHRRLPIRPRIATVTLVIALLPATVCAAPATRPALNDAPIASLMPLTEDYAFLWWANGWEGDLTEDRRPIAPETLCLRTGRYGLALDLDRLDLPNFGVFDDATPAHVAVAESNEVVLALPQASLRLYIDSEGDSFTCTTHANDQQDPLDFPVRIVESGRCFQRLDVHDLIFENAGGQRLLLQARLELAAWPDRLALILDVTPGQDLHEPTFGIELRSGKSRWSRKKTISGVWQTGVRDQVALSLLPGAGIAPAETPPESVTALALASNEAVPVSFDPVYGWFRIDLPRGHWQIAEEPDHLDRVRLTLANPSPTERTVRLLLAKDYAFPGITGMCPMLRDGSGHPTGIVVQVSKNWHRQQDRRLLYEGPWFHGFAVVHLPASSRAELEFAMAYARWGGVPSASHAQLSLIGWGHNQLWDQAAIGSWGESICYEPDAIQKRCRITDVRPLMVFGMRGEQSKWTWTNNVGGGDFLVYYDEHNAYQPVTRIRTHYESHGPCLTRVTYAGRSANGHIAMRATVSSPRCDDINRAFHHIRYDVLEPTPFTRLALYQLGADDYNWHQNGLIAYGNEQGVTEEWEPDYGGRTYARTSVPCPGAVPWWSLHQVIDPKENPGAWANRGLVIRSWRARLGGRDTVPHASVFRTTSRWGVHSTNVELSPPPDVTELQPGDFVEADIELAVMPAAADDYYGPNEGLRVALRDHANTWRMLHREAVGNALEVPATRGEVLRSYPVTIQVDRDQTADFTIAGGIGYVPVTFVGLDSPTGYTLARIVDGQPQPIDQSVHGNDFWQADYSPHSRTWSRTYNLPLDSTNNPQRTTRLVLERAHGTP